MKRTGKKVSVIVPVYDCEKYLDGCIRSILAQTYDNLEVLLIDDGATDDTQKKRGENRFIHIFALRALLFPVRLRPRGGGGRGYGPGRVL